MAQPRSDPIHRRNRRAQPRNRLFLVRQDQVACGLVGLADIDLVDKIAMVWYCLGEDRFARQGVTTAALQQLAHVAFTEFGLASCMAGSWKITIRLAGSWKRQVFRNADASEILPYHRADRSPESISIVLLPRHDLLFLCLPGPVTQLGHSCLVFNRLVPLRDKKSTGTTFLRNRRAITPFQRWAYLGRPDHKHMCGVQVAKFPSHGFYP